MSDYIISNSKDIVMVTLNNVPNSISFISEIFNTVSENNINVDMISQTAPYKGTTNISFTILESDIQILFNILKSIKAMIPDIITGISGNHTKIVISNKNMPNEIGIAAKIFNILNELDVNLNLVTTADEEISILIESTDFETVYSKLNESL